MEHDRDGSGAHAPVGPVRGAFAPSLARGVRAHRAAQPRSGDPGRTLHRNLGDARGLLLFIDQLEEIVTIADPVQSRIVGRRSGTCARASHRYVC